MKNKLIIIFSIILIISCYMFSKKDNDDVFYELDNKTSNNMLSMMLETSAGSGEYQKTSASTWPTEGYVFNESLSKCEKGSSLSWDSTKNTVVMMGNNSDKCYVYFDLIPPVYLADHIKSLYTSQGANNLYLHDNSLTNGAKDNSYRYAGPSDTTNNFVCFGYDSTDGSCPSDNLYRIIGVFGDEVKLIKYDYAKSTLLGTDGEYYGSYSGSGTNKGQNSKTEIGAYYWNYSNGSSSTNDWSLSRLNTVNLNKNYLNKIDENGTKWSEKISDHTWKVGGNTYNNISKQTAPNAYQNEINSPATNKTVKAKVGLMYVSDYGYAVEPSAWGTTLYNYDSIGITNKSWMYMGLVEWTLAPRTDVSDHAFRVNYGGYVTHNLVNINTLGVRPVLYLKSTIAYVSGSGTISSPILIS